MLVYRINYSEQVEAKKISLTTPIDIARWFLVIPTFDLTLIGEPTTVNNDKGSNINLTNEMSESNRKFGYTSMYHWRAEQIEERIEIPAKESCRIM